MHLDGQDIVAEDEIRGRDAERAFQRRVVHPAAGERGEGHVARRHADAPDLGAIEVNNRPVVDDVAERQLGLGDVACEVEVRTEIESGLRLVGGECRANRLGQAAACFVGEQSWTAGPARVVVGGRAPGGAQVRAGLVVTPRGREAKESPVRRRYIREVILAHLCSGCMACDLGGGQRTIPEGDFVERAAERLAAGRAGVANHRRRISTAADRARVQVAEAHGAIDINRLNTRRLVIGGDDMMRLSIGEFGQSRSSIRAIERQVELTVNAADVQPEAQDRARRDGRVGG